jgi:quinol monooxygenase YgiN
MKTAGIILILLVATLALPLGNSFAVPISNPPTNLVAQAISSTQINLSWNAPINSTQNGVSGYKIEQDVSCDGSFVTIIANNTSTTYSNTGLNAGACYAYRVSALNSAGVSTPSNVDFDVTFATPSVPSGVTVTASSATSLKIAWNAPTNNGGTNISGYQIQRNGTILVSNTGNANLAYIDTGLKPLTSQTYKIAAWNSAGLGSFSVNVTAKTLNQTTTPLNKENLGQAVSEFIHKRNELLKKQREETMKLIQDCHNKTLNATGTARKQVMEDCREMMKTLKDKYKDSRKQFREEFKTFRDDTKSLLKEAKKSDLIDKEDIKDIRDEFRDYNKDAKRESKGLKQDIKELRKDLKKDLKEQKKDKKNKHHDEDED